VTAVFPLLRAFGSVEGRGERGRVTASRDVFRSENGDPWSWQGVTMFRLFHRWLLGETIEPQLRWCRLHHANVVRVLGMVNWPGRAVFGPSSPGYFAGLVPFVDSLAAHGIRVEFVVFASAQDLMPDEPQQRAHLRRVHDAIGGFWNVFLEVCNEPFQNGCVPRNLWPISQPRLCPMAYGDYNPAVAKVGTTWVATLPALDYLTWHGPRQPNNWMRQAKDLSEFRDGYGDGTEEKYARFDGLHIPPVSDEPMGAAEREAAGPQRSTVPEEFFWHHANARINGAGSTLHGDFGLDAVVPPAGGVQEQCAAMVTLAWDNIPPEFQRGRYTRGGLDDMPLKWQPEMFPDETSRVYGRILGNRAICVAIRPNPGWTPAGDHGWRIVNAVGPQNSLVYLER